MSLSKARYSEANQDSEQSLMCAAKGCPNHWSTDFGNGKLCSWHDRSPPHYWPQITQEQLDASADRARAAEKVKVILTKLTYDEKVALLNTMRQALKVVR
jgi:hypothetical protein